VLWSGGVVDGEKFRLMMRRRGLKQKCWKEREEGERKKEATAEASEAWYGAKRMRNAKIMMTPPENQRYYAMQV